MSEIRDRGLAKKTLPFSTRKRRIVFRISIASMLLIVAMLSVSCLWLRRYLDSRSINWQPYSAAALREHLDEGRIVLVDFTAQWHISMKHHQLALNTPALRAAIRRRRVVPLCADWTNPSAEIRAELRSLGQNSIPLVVIYSPSSRKNTIVLRYQITEEQILDALETIGNP